MFNLKSFNPFDVLLVNPAAIIIVSVYLSITCFGNPTFHRETINGTNYDYVIADLESINIVYEDELGEAIRTFQRLESYCKKHEIDCFAVMNGGIFEPGGKPTGLLVQDKELISPLNLNDGKGNFYLKPNGVFYITKNEVRIIESSLYDQVKEEVCYATQSGPLLVSGGGIHGAFDKASKSRKLRNGVGVLGDGRVILAISKKGSERQPNLFEFASFFISKGCKNALYLDGTISELRRGRDLQFKSGGFSSFVLVEGKKAQKVK